VRSPGGRGSRHIRLNRDAWDQDADAYQAKHDRQLSGRRGPGWGVWSIPESRLRILGDVRGKDVLELGCGGAQWSIALARVGAKPVGLDLSERQLGHARRLADRAGVRVPLVHASAERAPFRDGSFDVVFCDHGAMSFADPRLTVPEAARLLRPGGLLAFNQATQLLYMCWNEAAELVEPELRTPYFGMRRFEYDESVDFQLPFGEWVRLFRDSGFAIEDLVELRPGPRSSTTYEDYVPLEWARRWPAEHVWKVRRAGGPPSPGRGASQTRRGSSSASRS
jgi:SAM-dependent methyltransferase